MFENFKEDYIDVGGLKIFVRHGGNPDAPGLLLLHGYPQTSAMWEGVAPLHFDELNAFIPVTLMYDTFALLVAGRVVG